MATPSQSTLLSLEPGPDRSNRVVNGYRLEIGLTFDDAGELQRTPLSICVTFLPYGSYNYNPSYT